MGCLRWEWLKGQTTHALSRLTFKSPTLEATPTTLGPEDGRAKRKTNSKPPGGFELAIRIRYTVGMVVRDA